MKHTWIVAVVAGAALLAGGFSLGSVRASGADPGSPADPLVSKSYIDQWASWRVVTLTKGQQLVADGGVEIVVRSGQATAVASAQGGLGDMTSGSDRRQGEVLPLNHLLVVSRGDGRGLIAAGDVVLIVKGSVTLQQAGAVG